MALIVPDNEDSHPEKVSGTSKQPERNTARKESARMKRASGALAVSDVQVRASGPGIEKSGCLVDQRAEFTVSARDAGKGPLKIVAQVWCLLSCCFASR